MKFARAHNPHHTPRRRAVGGFTLIEILVAVGIVALVAVGIAQIFGAVGETVTRGRQIARFNQLAAQIERQMREDFAAMTRDGFLVIRQQYADRDTDGVIDTDPESLGSYDGIEVTEDDAEPRPRRVDEILFFRRGDFVSAREPIHPDLIARSNEAMIYYGHGRRAYDDGTVDNQYTRPVIGDPVAELTDDEYALGRDDSGFSETNPNRFASDWTLLRKVTLLVDDTEASAQSTAAIESIARSINLTNGNILLDNDIQIAGQPAVSWPFRSLATLNPELPPANGRVRSEPQYPELETGLVDIATASIESVRTLVLDAELELNPDLVDEQVEIGEVVEDPNSIPQSADAYLPMRDWMQNALPANSLFGRRMRYEPEAPDYFGVLTDTSFVDALDQELARADQLALSSANFVPRCTEFVVEWSFGQTASGQVVWYGAEQDTSNPADDIADGMLHYAGAFNPFAGRGGLPMNVRTYQPSVPLIYGAAPDPRGPATATFGFIDPTFDSNTADDLVMPWPWPELIRVTVTIADEIDPTIEQTFQFVLEAPGTPDPE